jgi:hypothetical protein
MAAPVPFYGRSAVDEMAAVLTLEPVPLDAGPGAVPTAYAKLVAKALRKQPASRYHSAKQLLADLQAIESSEVRSAGRRRWRPSWNRVAATAGVVALLAAAAWFWPTRTPSLTEADAILLTDFTHPVGEQAFNGRALKRALEIQLRQTPFLHIVSEESALTALRSMTRPTDDPVTRGVGREICLRQGFKALVAGDVARLGPGYLVTLEAVGAESGGTIAMAQAEAAGLDGVLAALGKASVDLRTKLGESLVTDLVLLTVAASSG